MKRILSILLAMLLLVSLAACTQAPAETPTDTPPAETDSPADEAADEPADEAVDEPAEETPAEPAAPGTPTLPLTTEDVTFHVWTATSVSGLPITSYNENEAWKEVANRTGVNIDWEHAPQSGAAEHFNLSIVSGDYADAYLSGLWTGSMDYYVEEEIVADLTDLIPTLAPNYYAALTSDPQGYLAALTDSGRLVSFCEVAQSLQTPYVGPFIRQDFLDKVGKEVPETYDELYDVLCAFRDELGLEAPIAITPVGVDDWLFAGLGTVYATWFNEEFYQVDGQMTYGPATENFREGVEMLSKWYAEGLVDPEFYGRGFDSASADSELMCQDFIGCGRIMYSGAALCENIAENPDYKLTAMRAIVKNKGDSVPFILGGGAVTRTATVSGTLNVISTACEDLELMVRWFDYLYTDEGSLLLNYGVEGVAHTVDENGVPYLTEKIYNDPDLSLNQMLSIYTGSGVGGPWQYDWTREIKTPNFTPEQIEARNTWYNSYASVETPCTVNALTIAEEDASEYNSIVADMRTCIDENLTRFITGEKSVDTEWDDFVQTLYSMGLETALQMQQDAYDRIQARSSN